MLRATDGSAEHLVNSCYIHERRPVRPDSLLVDGKLRNSRALAYRIRRSRPQIAARWLDRIERAVRAVAQADDMNSMRGVAGADAKAYF